MYKSTILIMFAVVMCLFSGLASGLDLPIRIGCGNGSEIVDGDKVWLAGDTFATTPLEDWDFGTNFEYMSPDPAPAEVYKDSYHKNNWNDLTEYDEISVPVADGSYLVRLHLFSNNTTNRKFDIIIEGEIVLDDYDPQAEAILLGHATGANAIVIPEVIVEVSDGDGMQIRDMGGGGSDSWIGAVEIFAEDNPPAHEQTIRIMPLGDSITAGEHYGYPAFGERTGYRKPLYELLVASAYDVNFVGSVHWGFDITPPFDCDHEAWPGKTAGWIADGVYQWLVQNPPDIILAHVGTNGLNANNYTDVERMLNEIDRYELDFNVEIPVFLARIIHRYQMESQEITTAFNDNVEAMALSRVQNQGDVIFIVDMENGAGIDYMTDGDDMWGTTHPGIPHDTYHPTPKGDTKMANLWFEHLDNFLSPAYTANRPYPRDKSYVWPGTFTGLRWSLPAPRHPNDVVTCNVYIGTDPNALGLIAANEPIEFLSSDVYPINPDTAYYWRVDCNDPNAGNPVITEGRVWTFHTFDPVPKVYAGKDMSGGLPPRGGRSLVLQMDARVTDEGDPNAVLYYLWSVESAPADVPDVVFDDNTIEDPIVTFSAAGEYILRLSASDDGPVESQESKDIGSDTVTITVQ